MPRLIGESLMFWLCIQKTRAQHKPAYLSVTCCSEADRSVYHRLRAKAAELGVSVFSLVMAACRQFLGDS